METGRTSALDSRDSRDADSDAAMDEMLTSDMGSEDAISRGDTCMYDAGMEHEWVGADGRAYGCASWRAYGFLAWAERECRTAEMRGALGTE